MSVETGELIDVVKRLNALVEREHQERSRVTEQRHQLNQDLAKIVLSATEAIHDAREIDGSLRTELGQVKSDLQRIVFVVEGTPQTGGIERRFLSIEASIGKLVKKVGKLFNALLIATGAIITIQFLWPLLSKYIFLPPSNATVHATTNHPESLPRIGDAGGSGSGSLLLRPDQTDMLASGRDR